MISIEFAAIAEYASFDECGQLCLMGIVRELYLKSLPSSTDGFYVVARVRSDGSDATSVLGVRLRRPDGTFVEGDELASDAHPHGDYIVFILRDVVFDVPGEYSFVIETDRVLASLPVDVTTTEPRRQLH